MTSERERMTAGGPYDPSHPDLVEDRRVARVLTRAHNERTDPDERRSVLESLFGSVDGRVYVEPPFRCDYGYNIHVGDAFYANFGCVFLDICPIEFGEKCMLGPGVHAYAATHPVRAEERYDGEELGDGITVGDRVWIGGQAILTPGVTVGDEAVVAAGAVVTEDVPPRTVVGGNPATVIRDIDAE